MPLDAVCLTGVVNELTPTLIGARIDKVQQPERDLLLLSLYTVEGNKRLLISANVGAARLHYTRERLDNPDSPPMFCMLLRKHLTGARITAVTNPPFERLVILELSTRDELGTLSQKRLAIELMGRSANVILVGEDGVIIDCLRRADFGEDAVRRLLPGMLYRLPPAQSRINFFTATSDERRAAWETSDAAKPYDKRLLDCFSGLSPLTARELAYRGEADMPGAMEALYETVSASELAPTMLMEDGRARDYSFMAINQYGAAVELKRFDSFCALLEEFYQSRDKAERMRRVSSETAKRVRTLRDRQQRKLAAQREELILTAGREVFRKKGELITANLWRIKKGDRALTCEDYYTEGSPELTLALDPLKTPQQNAAAAYKEYKKKAAAELHLTALIEEGERALDYLESVLDQLSRAENERDVAELRRELVGAGYLKQGRTPENKKLKPRAPLEYRSPNGHVILIGRSNTQNDELTFKIARKADLWLHVQKLHGSHVILRADVDEPKAEDIECAAALAAWYSEGRESGAVPVDFTQVKNVKKPSAALPGKVIYTDYRTIAVRAAEPEGAK